MNEIKTFTHPLFGDLPVIIVEGKEYFGAIQVAVTLGYSNPHDALTKHCKKEGVVFHEVLTSGGKQQKKFINEGNLYRLIVKSKLPGAEKFEAWVFDTVLPSVRKHGAYMTDDVLEKTLNDPDYMIGLLTVLKEEKQKRITAEETVEKQKTKVLFAQAVETSESSILVGELAKILKQNGIEMGQKRLFEWLREKGYLIRKKGEEFNNPTQRSMELGLFEITKRTINNPDGSVRVTRTPKVTGKGQIYFVNKFLKGA